ncbi:unnamed protein product [Ceratitis capitata]|uniref:(Mediterranean fruit fly) hypothetical protein n=1 Tax=Ceratitis capitata TaxID=7213 RepID=A0A811ULF7_CERCA|nr:unnamed protein product [Ceratitis capitata]
MHNNQQQISNSTTNLSESRSNLTNPAPTPCQRLSEMFRRSIASSVQSHSNSRENTMKSSKAVRLRLRLVLMLNIVFLRAAALRPYTNSLELIIQIQRVFSAAEQPQEKKFF